MRVRLTMSARASHNYDHLRFAITAMQYTIDIVLDNRQHFGVFRPTIPTMLAIDNPSGNRLFTGQFNDDCTICTIRDNFLDTPNRLTPSDDNTLYSLR